MGWTLRVEVSQKPGDSIAATTDLLAGPVRLLSAAFRKRLDAFEADTGFIISLSKPCT